MLQVHQVWEENLKENGQLTAIQTCLLTADNAVDMHANLAGYHAVLSITSNFTVNKPSNTPAPEAVFWAVNFEYLRY